VRRAAGIAGPTQAAALALLLCGCLPPPARPASAEPEGQRRLSVGGSHACLVHRSGQVLCWGRINRELADTSPSVVPAQAGPIEKVPGIRRAREVVSGGEFICVRLSAGEVRCWGRLAGWPWPPRAPVATPTQVAGTAGVLELVAGVSHACVRLPGGRVACWGHNHAGQLGDGTTRERTFAVPIAGLEGAIGLAASDDATCALMGDRTVRCWGDHSIRRLRSFRGGGGLATCHLVKYGARPVAVGGLSGVRKLTSGNRRFCAARDGGETVCWGHVVAGRPEKHCDRAEDDVPSPKLTLHRLSLPGGARSLAESSRGGMCWVEPDGGVSCAYRGPGEQPSDAPRRTPGLSGVVELATCPFGYQDRDGPYCALDRDDQVTCWGADERLHPATRRFHDPAAGR
jgi:hypothetical protein